MSGIIFIPNELVLSIVSFLDIQDVMALRHTCKQLHDITKDKHLWWSFFLDQQASVPVPHFSQNALSSHPIATVDRVRIEEVVMSVYRTQKTWLSQRESSFSELLRLASPSPREPWGPKSIIALDIFLDRWIVAVFQEVIEVWDLMPQYRPGISGLGTFSGHKPALYAQQACVNGEAIYGSTSCLSSTEDVIFVAIASDQAVRLVRFHLPDPSALSANAHVGLGKVLHSFPINTPRVIRAYDPPSNVIAISHSQGIFLVCMESQVRWEIGVEEEGELWSGVTGVRFLTSRHILCVNTRSVVLITFSGSYRRGAAGSQGRATPKEVQVNRHDFQQTTFRGVSFSKERMVRLATGNTVISCDFLAFDFLRGLYHYRVEAHFSPDFVDQEGTFSLAECLEVTVPLLVDVTLVSIYPMAQLVPLPPVSIAHPPPPRSGFTPGPRSFVIACALGPQGKRAIWVERQRNAVERTIYGFNFPAMDTQVTEPVTIQGSHIYRVSSYDLRDDTTHCCFSEGTGKIVLGLRGGELLLLE